MTAQSVLDVCCSFAHTHPDFDFESFERQNAEDRTRLALKYFPDARTFFGHHALRHQFAVPWFHKIEEDDACQRVDAVWEALSDADTQDWATLLHRSHKQGDLFVDEAAVLLSRQGVSEKLLQSLGQEERLEEGEVAVQDRPEVEPAATHLPQSQPLPMGSHESSTGHVKILGQPADASHPSTMVRFVGWSRKPGTYAILLPIGTPECPVSDAFPAEVQDACRNAFSDRPGLPEVHRLGPNAWIAQIGKESKTVNLTSYLLTRALRLRGHSFRAFAAPRFPPIRFEANFSDASDVLTFEVINHIHAAFANLQQPLPEVREESRVPVGRRFVVTFSSPPGLFCFYLLIRARDERPFVAIFRPRYVNGLCWMCRIRHEGSVCPRSRLVPYSS